MTAMLIGLFIAAPPASAEDPAQRWMVQPSGALGGADARNYFVYSLNPGQSVQDEVAIVNLSDQPLTLSVLGTDAYTDSTSGAFGLLPSADEPTDTGAWVRLAADSVTIPEHSRAEVPFVLAVPSNATPGDHAGGIVTSLLTSGQDANGQNVLFDARIAVRIYLTVAGDLAPSLAVRDVSASLDLPVGGVRGTLTVDYTVANTGNVRLGGQESVRVTGPLGIEFEGRSSTIAEILPGGEVRRHEVFEDVPAAFWLTSRVEVTPTGAGSAEPRADAPVASAAATTAAVPWLWVLVAVLVIACIVLLVVRRRRAWRAMKAELADARSPDANSPEPVSSASA